MAQDIDLTSPQWTAFVFEGRNKEYGAYEMRNDSSNRHLKALIIITIVGLAVVYLPNLFKSDASKDAGVAQITGVEMSVIDINKPKDDIIEIQPVLPPVNLMSTTKFVPPVVVPDDMVNPDDKMATQVELTESNLQISIAKVTGSEDGTLDIRDVVNIVTDAPATSKPFVTVEQMPQFPGGEQELMRWLSSNIRYPALAEEKEIQGRVVIQFVVRSDGSIDEVTVLKSLEPSCDKEAVRAVKNMPKWIAGRQNGNAVNVYYTLPVQFKLQKSK